MRGQKILLARDTALVFGEAMDKLGVATSILGFSTGSGNAAQKAAKEAKASVRELSQRFRLEPLLHVVFKTFAEKFDRISGRLDGMEVHRLTPLGESMLLAARELARRPEERKLLFVLTDGRPAVGMDDEDITFAHAKNAIQRIERAGIDVALVGIADSSVLSLHSRSVVVQRIEELPRTVMTQLQTLLTGPQRQPFRMASGA